MDVDIIVAIEPDPDYYRFGESPRVRFHGGAGEGGTAQGGQYARLLTLRPPNPAGID